VDLSSRWEAGPAGNGKGDAEGSNIGNLEVLRQERELSVRKRQAMACMMRPSGEPNKVDAQDGKREGGRENQRGVGSGDHLDDDLSQKFERLGFNETVLPLLIDSARRNGHSDPEHLLRTFRDNYKEDNDKKHPTETDKGEGKEKEGVFVADGGLAEREGSEVTDWAVLEDNEGEEGKNSISMEYVGEGVTDLSAEFVGNDYNVSNEGGKVLHTWTKVMCKIRNVQLTYADVC
jgi:hypothetical protein